MESRRRTIGSLVMAYFKFGDHRLAYSVYGDGPRTTVLLPGLLFSQRMHVPLARALADGGNRVITLDLLGHGKSDRPRDMRQYSMVQFAEQTIALLDHLVIGHPRDPVHPFSDADALARELANARLVDANSIIELRLWPERLTGEICEFVDSCWKPSRAAPKKGTRAKGRARGARAGRA